MDFKKLTAKIIKGSDIKTETGRAAAYRKCIDYAKKHMAKSLHYNEFMIVSAKRLGQTAVISNVAMRLAKPTGKEKINLWFIKGSGPVLKANKEGMLFLSRVFKNLAETDFDGEHVHFRYDEPPMVPRSYPLEVMLEDNKWFKGTLNVEKEQKEEKEIKTTVAKSNVIPEKVAAVQFNEPLPPVLPLSQGRLYKVISVEPYKEQKVWCLTIREEKDRLYVFNLINDDKEQMGIALDIDDTVNNTRFYVKEDLEQVSVN